MEKQGKYGQTETGRPFLPHPSYEEYQRGLRAWQERFPDRLRVSARGRTLQGREVLLVEVTDFRTPPDDKQVVFYTCTHVGMELNAMTTALHFIKWLLGNSRAARETRRKQVVLLVPIAAPDAFVEQRRADPGRGEGDPSAGYYSWQGILKPEKNPEAVVLDGILREYHPDVHIDAHGFAQADATMCESTGVSGGSALVARTFAPQVIERMIAAADRAGFGVRATNGEWGGGFMECTGEILCQYRAPDIGPEYDDCLAHRHGAHHFHFKESNITLPVYAYHRCHSLATLMEIGMEQSALAQLKTLMAIGNRPWITETVSGYPVNVMGYGQCVALAGYGRTALQRRQSRVEIWEQFNRFGMGYGNPPHRGECTALFSTTARGAGWLHPSGETGLQQYETARNSSLQPIAVYDSFAGLFARLKGKPEYDVQAMAGFQERSPVDRYHVMYAPFGVADYGAPLRHGLAVRLFLSFAGAQISRVLLNGRSLEESDTFGYRHWGGSGTIVQVHLPPEKIGDLLIVQCAYEMQTRHPCGFAQSDWTGVEGAPSRP